MSARRDREGTGRAGKGDAREDLREACDAEPATSGGASLVGDAAARSRAWKRLVGWAHELGFSQIGVSGIDLSAAEPGLRAWLEAGFHGEMGYMAAHGMKRARPAELVPGTLRVVTVWMDYLPRAAFRVPTPGAAPDWRTEPLQRLADPGAAVVSVYAHGRDYHRVLRQRLQKLAERLAADLGPLGHRAFVDSAPVLEVELARRSGLGWRGKHTLALTRERGSTGFLGELFVDVPFETTEPTTDHCGRCTACIDACPTGAIVAPYRLDARRCISYLTLELQGPIPPELRRGIGNRIAGCDDCQIACPWNRWSQPAALADFDARPAIARASLLELWAWDEAAFLRHTEGSALRRIGWPRWRRNVAVALGNALAVPRARGQADAIRAALARAAEGADALLGEHIAWALAQRPEGPR